MSVFMKYLIFAFSLAKDLYFSMLLKFWPHCKMSVSLLFGFQKTLEVSKLMPSFALELNVSSEFSNFQGGCFSSALGNAL